MQKPEGKHVTGNQAVTQSKNKQNRTVEQQGEGKRNTQTFQKEEQKFPNPKKERTGEFLLRAVRRKQAFLCANLRFDMRVGSLPKAENEEVY